MAKVYANVLKEQSYLEQICFWTYMTDNKRKYIIICTQNTKCEHCLGKGKIISISHGAITMHKVFTF